jgi:CheY-like chemotaxis protein
MNNSIDKNGIDPALPQRSDTNADEAWRQRLSERLRTRLNAIIGFSELLALEPLTVNGRGDLKEILKAARDLLTIVNQELGFETHIITREAGQNGSEQQTCDLLYIEDDIANVTLVERILQLRPGLTMKHSTTGRAGVETAALHHPRLILLDLNLPDIHGAEVLQLLQNAPQTSQIPVVVLSANAAPTQIERLLTAGARNYLTKPFDLDHFLAVLDEWTRSEKPVT